MTRIPVKQAVQWKVRGFFSWLDYFQKKQGGFEPGGLGGGFKHVLFSPLFGEDAQID